MYQYFVRRECGEAILFKFAYFVQTARRFVNVQEICPTLSLLLCGKYGKVLA